MTETYAASYASADMNWVRCIVQSLLFADFDLVTQWPRHSKPPPRGPTVLRTDRPEVIDPMCSLCSDSKCVYDALNNELPQDDKKAAVEMPIIEELLSRMHGRCRWFPHNVNPSDGLTKLKGAHIQPLMDLLATGFYHLRTEEVNLQERAQAKAETGYAPRLKQSGRKENMVVSRQYFKFLEAVCESHFGNSTSTVAN